MDGRSLITKRVWFIGVLMGSVMFSVQGTEAMEMKLKGNLIMNPPCELTSSTGSNTIEVDFGDVIIRQMETQEVDYKATSAKYQTILPLKLECDASNGTAVRIKIVGTPAGFNNDFLATNNARVGVQFINLGKGTFIPNSNVRRAQVIVGKSATFYVVPIRDGSVESGSVLAGEFKATATLQADYE